MHSLVGLEKSANRRLLMLPDHDNLSEGAFVVYSLFLSTGKYIMMPFFTATPIAFSWCIMAIEVE